MLSRSLSDFIPINLDEMRSPGFLSREERHVETCVASVDAAKGWRAVDACPLCRSSKRTILFSRFAKDVAQCNDCTLGYMTEFPNDPNDVYSDQDYLPSQEAAYIANVAYRKARFGKERLEIIARNLGGLTPSEAKLLDIGCGTGWFLECAQKRGYQVYGLERGKDLGAFTAKRLGITVWNADVQDLKTDQRFHVITMFDVIEHVTDPISALRAIARLLRPDGFALIFTPQLDSFGLSVLKEKSSLVTPAEHLLYFTPASFERLAQSAGLSLTNVETRGTDIADIYSYYRDELAKPDVAEFLEQHSAPLQAMIDAANCANHMRAVLRPTPPVA